MVAYLHAEGFPNVVFAEIVHLPKDLEMSSPDRCCAIMNSYIGRSAVSSEQQIPVTDLYVSVQGNRIRLRSARTGREVVRMTNAHNYSWEVWACTNSVHAPASGNQRLPALGLGSVVERSVFAAGDQRATGTLWALAPQQEELRALGAIQGAARFRALDLRLERHLPGWLRSRTPVTYSPSILITH